MYWKDLIMQRDKIEQARDRMRNRVERERAEALWREQEERVAAFRRARRPEREPNLVLESMMVLLASAAAALCGYGALLILTAGWSGGSAVMIGIGLLGLCTAARLFLHAMRGRDDE